MKHYLLNHQPQKGLQAACAQQGQAPTCNARGKGRTPASPKTLTRILLVLLTMFLLPSAAWGQITVAGISPNQSGNITGTGIKGTVTYSNGTLTLTGAEITGDIVWNPSENTDLTINLSGNNTLTGTISTDKNISSTVETNLSFTGSTDCSLEITKESGSVISGNFKTVNFGNFNLATSSPGAYWDGERMADYSGSGVSNLKITSEVYYPIWVMHKQGTSEHTQLTSEVTQVNLVREIDDTDVVICTVFYDATSGKLTIEANEAAGDNAFQPGGSNAAIVVGPSMEELKVHLKGKTKITDYGSFVFSIWDTTSLIFTTDETSPGSLTGTEIVNWKSKNSGGTGQITYKNGLVFNYDSSSTNTETISTTGTRIKIGEGGSETVISASTDENGLFNGTVFFNASENILTLKGARLGNIDSYGIKVFVDDLKVVISGENTILGDIIYSGNSRQSSSIQINKATDEATLTLSGIDSFGACIWGEGLYLTAFGQGTTNAIAPHYEYSNGEGHFCDYSGSSVSNVIFSTTVSYPLWVGGVQVTDDNKDGITGITYTVGQGSYTSISSTGTSTGTVSFNPTGNILKLTNVTLSSPLSDCDAPIISNLPNLEIDVNGRCNLSGYKGGFISDGTGGIKSVNADATLVISTNYTTSSGTDSPTMQIDTYDPIASGFKSISTDNQMIYKRTSGYYWVQRIAQPTISLVNGSLLLSDKNEIDLSYTQNSAVTLKYKITDAAGTAGEEKIFDSNTNEPIENPCTIDAWAVYQSQESELVTGKYFGIADKTIVFNNKTKGSELKIDDLEISPATEDVTFTIVNAYNSSVISYDAENGATIVGIGACNIGVKIDVDEGSNIQILNTPTLNPDSPGQQTVYIITKNITVIPDKPSIEKDTEYDYLETDKITITRTSVDGESADNIKIFYTWDEEAEIGSDYTHDTTNPTLTIYTDAIPAQSGTLRAWVGYSLGDGEYLMSEADSKEFEVKKDIALCRVTLPENATYTGAAFVPVVEAPNGTTATTLTEGTDYTVSYQKVAGETATDVESMIDAGTYKITITGTGSYGGTKEITDFQIAQASLADAAISKLIVGDKEYTYDGKVIEIPYTGEAIQPEVVVIFNDGTVTVDASEYTVSYGENNTEISNETAIASVTVTSTNKNFTGGTSRSLEFKIVPAPVTITAEAQTVTYNAKQQAYTGASVDNENAALVIAYYTSEEDRTTGLNALTGAPTDAGTYYVSVTLSAESQQHYTAEPANVTFTIAQLDISEAVITLDKEELTYNGEEQSVNVTKVMAGDIEVAADYYEVSGNSGTVARSYTLTVTAKLKNSDGSDFKNNFKGSAEKAWKINHRTIPADVIAEKFTSEGQTYATFYDASESFLAPQGIVAYIITGVSGNSVTVKAVSYIKAGIPVLLQKTSTSTETEETTDDIFATNILKYAEIDLTANGGQYVLYKNEFVKATGSITSGKCYLDLTGTSFAGTRGFSIAGGAEGTTAISDAVADSDHSEWFDLQGRKIEKPSKKGLYIRDGKKIVVK